MAKNEMQLASDALGKEILSMANQARNKQRASQVLNHVNSMIDAKESIEEQIIDLQKRQHIYSRKLSAIEQDQFTILANGKIVYHDTELNNG